MALVPSLSPARLSLIASLLLAAVGCGGSGGSIDYGPLPAAELEGKVVLDLAELLPFAERMNELDEIRPSAEEHRRLLVRGWSHNDRDRATRAETDWVLWAQGHESSLRWWVREPADRTLRVAVQTVPDDNHALQRARLTLNGQTVAERLVPEGAGLRPWEIHLPGELMQPGLNQLSFHFSHTRHLRPMDGDPRALSANIRTLRFEVDDSDVGARARDARALLEDATDEGSRTVPQEGGRRGVVEQVAGSALRHYLLVPEGEPFLHLGAFYGGGDAPSARFRVRVERDGADPELLIDELVAAGADAKALRVDLSDYAGQAARFDFELCGMDEAGEPVLDPVLGTWVGPVVAGSEPSPLLAEDPELTQPSELAGELQNAPIIVLLLDALRPDALEFYGGTEGLVPHLSRIAQEGTVFENAYSHAAYTLSSVGSVLTSRYTWEHAVWRKENKLIDELWTWPERFQAAGYRTVGVTHTPNGSSISGYERGFDSFVENLRADGGGVTTADAVLPTLREAFAADDGRPLFAWLHLIEPHEPYQPPGEWRDMFDRDYESAINGDHVTLTAIRGGGIVPTPRELQHLWLEYEANLAYGDHVVGMLRDLLEEQGIWDDAIFVLFSDHGEAFMEHRVKDVAHQGHGRSLYEEVTTIPMVVRLPSHLQRGGTRSAGIVNSLDLYPTLAELVGVDTSQDGTARGRSFAHQLVDPEESVRATTYFHTATWQRDRFYPGFGLRAGDYKVLASPGEYLELYELGSDPEELIDLAPQQPVLANALFQLFAQETGWDPKVGGWVLQLGAETEVDEATQAILDALGYGGD